VIGCGDLPNENKNRVRNIQPGEEARRKRRIIALQGGGIAKHPATLRKRGNRATVAIGNIAWGEMGGRQRGRRVLGSSEGKISSDKKSHEKKTETVIHSFKGAQDKKVGGGKKSVEVKRGRGEGTGEVQRSGAVMIRGSREREREGSITSKGTSF